MTEDIYRELQERLDHYSVGFPSTQSGIELDILKELFSPDDAAMFLSMTQKLETCEEVAERTGKTLSEVAAKLKDMTERGLLFRLKRGESVRYGAIPFVHGLFEFQVKDLGQNLAKMVDQYHEEGFSKSFEKIGGMFLRTVPVQKSSGIMWRHTMMRSLFSGERRPLRWRSAYAESRKK
jgi:electron transport complex protein RnfB